MYFPVKFEKFGEKYYAIKVENSVESENIGDIYDWIDEHQTFLDFEAFEKCIENGETPDTYHVFSEDSVGYVLITKHDSGASDVQEFDNEEMLREMFEDEFVETLLKNGEFYDDSNYDADEIDDGTVMYILKEVTMK